MDRSVVFAVAGIFLMVFLVVSFAPWSDAKLARRTDRTAREVGLPLTREIEPVVARRVRRADRYAMIGAAVAWSVTFALLGSAVDSDRFGSSVTWVTLGAMVVGRPAGNAIAALVDARASSPRDRPRIARSRSVRMADYVPAGELIAVRLVTSCTLLTVGVTSALGLLPLPVAVGMVVLSLVSFTVLEFGGRRIVEQHQTAHTTTDLAWDDALRAKNLRALVAAPVAVGLYTALAVLFALEERPRAPDGVIVWGLGLVVVALAAVGIWRLSRTDHRDQYYLRRLWPDTAAAQTEHAVRASS